MSNDRISIYQCLEKLSSVIWGIALLQCFSYYLPESYRRRTSSESESKMAGQVSGKFPLLIGGQFTPHIASTIFSLLDKQELTKSRSVSSTWKDIVDSRTNLWNDPWLFRKAVYEGNLELCQRIIEKLDIKNTLVKRSWSWSYRTPLHIAAGNGHIEICRLILDHLEEKNPKNDECKTPLHCAAGAENPGAVKVYCLIMNEIEDKNPKDKEGITPLHNAVELGNFEVSKLIVESVDEKNPATIQNRITPLHLAARFGHPDIFRLIFEKVEEKNPPDSQGNTPLHCAAGSNRVQICHLILAHVDDKHPVNQLGQTPLDWARRMQGVEEFQELEKLWLED